MKIYSSSNTYMINNYSSNHKHSFPRTENVTFKAAPVAKKNIFDGLENGIAKVCAWLIQTKPMEKLITVTKEHQVNRELLNNEIKIKNKEIEEINKTISDKSKIQKPLKEHRDNLLAHLIVLGSTIMSGFYVAKTLNNKNMDEEKRKTLAINQGLVYIASTIMAYTFDFWAGKKIAPYMDGLKEVNDETNQKNVEKFFSLTKKLIPREHLEGLVGEKQAGITNEQLDKLVKKAKSILSNQNLVDFDNSLKTIKTKEQLDGLLVGAKKAKTIMTVDMVYRFIAPVIVTPLANAIGNKLQAKKEAELTFGNKK